jgi:hypothetical protein
VNGAAALAGLEEVIDRAQAAAWIEALLPIGARPRQLRVRTLLLGMGLALADHRPAHLTRVHQALTTLPEDDQARLGVLAGWKTGPHLLTYRQTERTFGLVTAALAKNAQDGFPSATLAGICDDMLEASIPPGRKDTSSALAVDWTDLETFSRPPPAKGGPCADPEASWGHRKNNLPGPRDELFFGYYLSAATMMPDENGPPIPELARRITLTSCRHDPARALVPVLGKLRCPLRPASMTLDRHRPEILTPPEHPPACCDQQTITVPPEVNAKTAQKHDYPSRAHRRSYARRTGAERSFATVKDPASNDISRGWCRLMGLAPILLFTACLLVVRNQRILTAWNARQAGNTRRAATGLPPRTRRRRRKTLGSLTAAAPP